MYRLKKNISGFQVMREGEFAYHRFEHGKLYDRIPPEDKEKFERILSESASEKKGGKQK